MSDDLLPYYYLEVGVEHLCPKFEWYKTFAAPYRASWPTGDYVRAVIAVGLVHIIIAMMIVSYTVRNFDRYVGRARQQHDCADCLW